MTDVRPSPHAKHHLAKDRGGKPKLLVGAALVFTLLFGSRWVSYLGIGPAYLSELSLAVIFTRAIIAKSSPRKTPAAPLAVSLCWALVVYSGARLLFSPAPFDLTALRDYAPYFYSIVAVLAYRSAVNATQQALDKTFKYLMVALTAHAIWFGLVAIIPSIPIALPTLSAAQGIHLLTPRNDVDSAINGMLCALLLHRFLVGGKRHTGLLQTLLFTLSLVTVLVAQSRAGLLATFLAMALAVSDARRQQRRLSGRRTRPDRLKATSIRSRVLVFLGLALIVSIVAVPATPVGQRLLATFTETGTSSSQLAAGATGTADAREASWRQLATWITSEPSRTIVGVGFGPNFMVSSGAGQYLIAGYADSETSPRSPHNYWLGTAARTGGLGLAIVVAILTVSLLAAIRSPSETQHALYLSCSIMLIALATTSTLGVVLESPFGALPFFWAVGVLAALGQQNNCR